MIGRLLSSAVAVLACFCLATLIAQAIMGFYVWSAWGMNTDRLEQMIAIAQGHDLAALRQKAAIEAEAVTSQQPSLAEIADARAMASRDLELREQALAQSVQQLRLDQDKYAEELAHFQQTEIAFESRLARMTESDIQEGLDQNIVMLQNMKPKQAKEQLVRMYDNKEIDDVVRLMAGMTPSKRKKISNEFRTPEDAEKLADILRRIREGYPTAELASEAREQLQQPIVNSR